MEAFSQVFGVSEVFVACRSGLSAHALVQRAHRAGVAASVVNDLDSAVSAAGIIVTATDSATPVLPSHVAPAAFVSAIGAFSPHEAELPPQLLGRGTVVVDDLERARVEAGDVIQAVELGAVQWSAVRGLSEVLASPLPTIPGPRVFKAVGTSLLDLAAAHLACGVS